MIAILAFTGNAKTVVVVTMAIMSLGNIAGNYFRNSALFKLQLLTSKGTRIDESTHTPVFRNCIITIIVFMPMMQR